MTLKQFLGKTIILYFYPKDDTPGCTTEACEFSAHYEKLYKKNIVVLGVSKDSTQSHRAFKKKFNLPAGKGRSGHLPVT
ncbi:MAG: peroxiredoxin [Gammaproteobacteria bacterium]|nr:peroxiredoxin [Gammaproteobacteria bacterium]